MEQNRSIDSIFASLQDLSELRELEKLEKAKLQNKLKCLCGKNEHSGRCDQDLEDSPFEFDQNSNELSEPIFLQKTQTGDLRFAVCPACHPRLHCQLCDGTGHRVVSKVHIFETSEGEDVKLITEDLCPNTCSCLHTEKIVELLNKADLPCKYMEADWSSFCLEHLNEAQAQKLGRILEKMQIFCSNIGTSFLKKERKSQKYFMTLFGPVGSGKTLLAVAALKALMINYGVLGKFIDFQFLLSLIKAEYDKQKSGENILSELRNADVLIIDEFGKGRTENEWQLEKLDDLVNARYNSNRVTILTTNYLPTAYKYHESDIPRVFGKSLPDYWKEKRSDTERGQIPVHENFWVQSLLERVGARMYERILEVSEFIDFMDIPSYRRYLSKGFLSLYQEG